MWVREFVYENNALLNLHTHTLSLSLSLTHTHTHTHTQNTHRHTLDTFHRWHVPTVPYIYWTLSMFYMYQQESIKLAPILGIVLRSYG